MQFNGYLFSYHEGVSPTKKQEKPCLTSRAILPQTEIRGIQHDLTDVLAQLKVCSYFYKSK
jgi:hypothetical protein